MENKNFENTDILKELEFSLEIDTNNNISEEVEIDTTKITESIENERSENLNTDFLIQEDSIFVAHDVKFDYRYISAMFKKVGLAPLLNRSLCSLALAERTITSFRYALSYLNDSFGLNNEATHHRAMSDVITTFGLFNLALNSLDSSVKTVEDLIRFSNNAKRLKRPKFDPFLIQEEKEEEKEEVVTTP